MGTKKCTFFGTCAICADMPGFCRPSHKSAITKYKINNKMSYLDKFLCNLKGGGHLPQMPYPGSSQCFYYQLGNLSPQ